MRNTWWSFGWCAVSIYNVWLNTEAPYFTVCRGDKIMFDLFKCQMKGIICVHMQNKVHFYIFSSKQCLSCAKVVALTLGVVHVLFYIIYFIALHCIALQNIYILFLLYCIAKKKKIYIYIYYLKLCFILLHCIALFCKIKNANFSQHSVEIYDNFIGFMDSDSQRERKIMWWRDRGVFRQISLLILGGFYEESL